MEANDVHARVAAMVRAHEPILLRVARHFSLCADDAQDAYQRALEIYVRRLDGVDPTTELAWLKVVVIRTIGHQRAREPMRFQLGFHKLLIKRGSSASSHR
jgi:DNA-directed RNA polymerase specialized sigma24 family protein